MDDLEIWVSRSTEVKCKDGFELAAYGFLFAPHTYIGTYLWSFDHKNKHAVYCCFQKWMTLKMGFKVNTGQM